MQKTHYDILSVKEDASYEEIRSSYRSAILDSHPDKASHSGHKFIEVQKAWEILSDSRLRAAYDNNLRGSRQQDDSSEASEDIHLEDMVVVGVEDGLELCYQCRCGDYFSVDSLDLGTMGYKLFRDGNFMAFEESSSSEEGLSVVIPCGSCSLFVRLLINTGSRVPIL